MITNTMPRRRKESEHYVNNKEFLEFRLIIVQKLLGHSKKSMVENPQKKIGRKGGILRLPITRYLGDCFLKIAKHLSFKPNFVNYMFKDDMISDGIEGCVQYIHNFDPEKSKNPFAYFTQIIHYAFLRRIQKEKRQLEIKNKIIEKSGFSEGV